MNHEAIRVAVAEEMGWERHLISKHDPFHCTKCGMHYSRSVWKAWEIPGLWCSKKGCPPYYTTSCDAALELVEKLRKEGWRCSLNNGLDGGWECEFIRSVQPVQPESPPEHVGFLAGEDVEVRYSLPMAICLGFLKVRGHTV